MCMLHTCHVTRCPRRDTGSHVPPCWCRFHWSFFWNETVNSPCGSRPLYVPISRQEQPVIGTNAPPLTRIVPAKKKSVRYTWAHVNGAIMKINRRLSLHSFGFSYNLRAPERTTPSWLEHRRIPCWDCNIPQHHAAPRESHHPVPKKLSPF